MKCKPEYKCLITLTTLYKHNVLINGEKWNKFENTDSPMTEDEIISEIEQNHCDTDQLIIFDYSKGWAHSCPKTDLLNNTIAQD